jgi:hypothetical protein
MTNLSIYNTIPIISKLLNINLCFTQKLHNLVLCRFLIRQYFQSIYPSEVWETARLYLPGKTVHFLTEIFRQGGRNFCLYPVSFSHTRIEGTMSYIGERNL